MLLRFWEYLKDRYLTWRTGYDREQRIWYKWRDETIVQRAGTIENMFMHFKHILIVDYTKFFDLNEPMAWVPVEDAKQYLWPQRELGNNAVYYFARVSYNQWDNRWHINDLTGIDKVFVATNNDSDALMISLKYA